MERRRRLDWIELAVAAYRLAGRHRLDAHPATRELVEHGLRRAKLAVGSGAQDQRPGQLALHLAEVLEAQRMALAPPPVRHDAVGRNDQVARLLLAIDNDAPEAVVLQPGHAAGLYSRE